MKFEWDQGKNRANIEKHGVDFEDAKELFDQPTIEKASERKGEDRTVAYGYLHGHPIVVVYTERGDDTYRLISARLATLEEEQELLRKLGAERRKQRQDRERKDRGQHKSKDRGYE